MEPVSRMMRAGIRALAVGLLLGGVLAFSVEMPPGGAGLVPLREAYSRPASEWPTPNVDLGVRYVELSRLQIPPAPSRLDRLRVVLGRRLFHDTILSIGHDLACSSCHDGRHGWSGGTPTSAGHASARGWRNVPALYNVAWRRHLGWDGRGSSLEIQSLLPLTVPDEMSNPDLETLLARLSVDRGYATQFAAAYGSGPISAGQLGNALATFERHLETVTRFDRFAAGDSKAFTDQEIWGLHLFRTKARCSNCHFGPLLTDEGFHNLKLSFFGERSEDLGRYQVTHEMDDVGRFRTPSLRHVAETAPYMHNGLFPTLEGVINLYDRGGGEVWARNRAEAANPLYPFAAHLSPHIRPLGLTAKEKAALVAFLRTL